MVKVTNLLTILPTSAGVTAVKAWKTTGKQLEYEWNKLRQRVEKDWNGASYITLVINHLTTLVNKFSNFLKVAKLSLSNLLLIFQRA